jgi:hypothetical protein
LTPQQVAPLPNEPALAFPDKEIETPAVEETKEPEPTIEPPKPETPPKVKEENKEMVVGLRRKPTIVNNKPPPEPEIPEFGEEPSLLLKEIVQIFFKREKLSYEKKDLEKLRFGRIHNPKKYH